MAKIAIYDRYLSTLGGGERYSCKMAEVLSKKEGYEVHLLTDLYCDKKKISERLNLDLSEVKIKIFGYISDHYAKRIASGYDIFINATYLSPLKGYGKRNIYLCYFPTPFDVDFGFIHRFLLIFFRLPAIWLHRLSDRLIKDDQDMLKVLRGIYDIKRFILKRGSWSNGNILIRSKYGESELRLGLKNPDVPGSPEKMKITIQGFERGQKEPFTTESFKLSRGEKQAFGLDHEKGKEYLVRIRSDFFYPGDKDKGDTDTRRLGVALYDERKEKALKKILFKLIGFIPLFLITYPKDLAFLDTYDEILAISEYSKYWIEKSWQKRSTLLFPPVDTGSFRPGKKDRLILSVGRFFPEHHNKKQLEMAEIFIQMLEQNPQAMRGYKLYLVGGLSDKKSHKDYVDKIAKIASGHPIRVITNSSWEKLVEMFSAADIFWHASGMGEEEEKNPERFEHFGITTVEAMASGCIPVVIDKGGQKEIIDNGKDGFLFDDWEGLKTHTLDIIQGKVDRESIRENALKSCQRFSNEAFSRRLLSIISRYCI